MGTNCALVLCTMELSEKYVQKYCMDSFCRARDRQKHNRSWTFWRPGYTQRGVGAG